jgi:hypothetical protein
MAGGAHSRYVAVPCGKLDRRAADVGEVLSTMRKWRPGRPGEGVEAAASCPKRAGLKSRLLVGARRNGPSSWAAGLRGFVR